jgi:hypothetical protein
MTSDIGPEKHRKVTGKWSLAVVADESGEAMPLNKRSELPGVVNSEGGWNVHLGITRRVAMSPNLYFSVSRQFRRVS